MTNIKLLRNRNFVLLSSANFINRLGDSIDAIALSWLTYKISDSASIAALNFAVNYIPTVFIQPFMGAFVNKHDKKHMMVIADGARALIIGLLAIVVMSDKVNTPMIIIGTFLISFFETLRMPSSTAIIPEIIESDTYKDAVAFNSSLTRVTELVGTGIAGFIIGFFGLYVAVFADALSFLISAILLVMINSGEKNTSSKENTLFQDLKDGLRYARYHRDLLYIMILACISNMLLVPFNALQSVFVDTYLRAGADILSVIGVFISLGSLCGATIYKKVSEKIGTRKGLEFIFPTGVIFYVGLLLCGYIHDPILLAVACAFFSFSSGIFLGLVNCYISVYVMMKCEKAYLSRISSLLNAASLAGMPLLSLIISFISNLIDIAALFVLSVIIMVIVWIYVRHDRRMELIDDHN